MEPAISPMGFDWKIGTALIGAFAAKEVFVAQMGIVYSVGNVEENATTLREKLAQNYSRLTAFCIMLFALISSPCVATVAVTRRESNTWRWAAFQFVGLTLLGYAITVIVYQVFSRVGLGV
jgi:ferrous iron transport protein B